MEALDAKSVSNFKQRFDGFVDDFISKTKNHSIISREKASSIVRILKGDPGLDDPQLKFYVKQKQFQLQDFPYLKMKDILCIPTTNLRKNSSRENHGMFGKYRRVALKDELFNIIYEIHSQEGSCRHLGCKSTLQEINRHHAHISQVLVSKFMKFCPLCSDSNEDVNSLSPASVSQFQNENTDNHFLDDSLVDIKPNIQVLSQSISQSHLDNSLNSYSSSSPSFASSHTSGVTSFQYCPAPPPSATQWSNSLPQENNDFSDAEIIDANHFMAVGRVSIIDIQELLHLSSPPRRYTCLVHYIDLWSKYSVLWPLKMRDYDELAFGIAKNVFAYFGSPKQIIFDTNFDEAQRLEDSLRKWSKQVKVTIGLQEPLASSGPVHWKIIEKLKELLVESWEGKLSKLQYISNTKLIKTHGHISPYKAVTGNDPMTEAFSELADKYNVYSDVLKPDFISSEMNENNVPPEMDSNTEIADYSVYPTFTPVISNICHNNLNDHPVMYPSASSGHQQVEPTPTSCNLDYVRNKPSITTKQLGTSLIDQNLSQNSDSVSVSMDQYSMVTMPETAAAEIRPLEIAETISNNNNNNPSNNHLIYIEDDDEMEEKNIDMKNIPLIDEISSSVHASMGEKRISEISVENSQTKNALLEDFGLTEQAFTSQNFIPESSLVNKDCKNIQLMEDFRSPPKGASTSQHSAASTSDSSVSVLDKLPRLAQSFSFPSSLNNRKEPGTFPNPTALETSLVSSLTDCGTPVLSRSAQNVIDKYRLRAKILNTTQMKAARKNVEVNPFPVKKKVQEPQPGSSMPTPVTSRLQSRQKILLGITSANTNRHESADSCTLQLKARTSLSSGSGIGEKRKEYWRRMKQQSRARLSQEEREMINQRRREKYAEQRRLLEKSISFFGSDVLQSQTSSEIFP